MRKCILSAALPALLAACCIAAAASPAPAEDGYDVVYLGETRPVLIRMYVHVDGRPLEAVWNDLIARIFKDLDTNGDGVLSRAEAERTPLPSVVFNTVGAVPGGGPNQATVGFAELDANKDGKVTRDVLARYFRAHGAAPFRLGSGAASYGGGVRAVFLGGGAASSPEEVNRHLFDLLDTNKDGKLSAAELAAGAALLRRFDLDDDEMISVDELNPKYVPPGETDGAVAFFEVSGAEPVSNVPFYAVRPGAADQELARRLLSQYGRKGKGAPATKLSRKDIGLDEATFKALDTNGDGSLDAAELARFAQRPSDVELMASVTHAGKDMSSRTSFSLVENKGRPSPLAAAVRRGSDGTLVLELGVARLELGNANDAASGVKVKFVVRQTYLQMFKQADRDNNGYLDQDEARRSPVFRDLFKVMDRDGDGKLFEKEVIAYLDQIEKLQAAAQKCSVILNVAPQGGGLFELLDTDHDRRLSVRELRQMGKLIARLDRDGDGQIGRDEIPRSFRLSMHSGGGNGGFFGAQAVVFAVNVAGYAGQPIPTPSKGPLWFRKMDRNGDGDVSRREFLGSDEEFRRIDLDGDGLISPEEAEKADQLLRKGKSGAGRKP